MKLNTKAFRYLSSDDWRVLTAAEIGTRNHEVVPTPLIAQLSGLRAGGNGVARSISTLAKTGLIAKVKNIKCTTLVGRLSLTADDGYRLTYGGLDYLALHAHTNSNAIVHLGSQMGVGKESDIYLVTSPSPKTGIPEQSIMKIHRLGRTSFRTLTRNRAYHGNRQHCSWQYLSRLSAQKEFAAMKALYDAGLPVPRPIAWNRHTVIMSLVPGIPLRQVPLSAFGAEGTEAQATAIAGLYGECMELALKLADVGCIHGDFNEFNLLVENVPDPAEMPEGDEGKDDSNKKPDAVRKAPLKVHMIDFPQITSLDHVDAEPYFKRDVDCIKRFFKKRYHFESDDGGPYFPEARQRLAAAEGKRQREGGHVGGRIDVAIAAAGFSKKMARELEAYHGLGDGEQEGEGEGQERDEAGMCDEEHDELESDEASVDFESGSEPDGDAESTRDALAAPVKTPGTIDATEKLTAAEFSARLAALSVSPSEPKPRTKAKAGWAI